MNSSNNLVNDGEKASDSENLSSSDNGTRPSAKRQKKNSADNERTQTLIENFKRSVFDIYALHRRLM